MPDLDKYEEALVESKLFQVKYLHLRYGAGAKGVRADKVEGLLGLPENSIRKVGTNVALCTILRTDTDAELLRRMPIASTSGSAHLNRIRPFGPWFSCSSAKLSVTCL